MNFEEIFSHVNGNFEEQGLGVLHTLLLITALLLVMHIIM